MGKNVKNIAIVAAVATGALLVGASIGHQLPSTKEQVREALYRACVNSTSYKPSSDNRDGFGCNRRTIDFTMATIYQESYVGPLPDLEARAQYEQELDKYKRH